MRKRKWLLFAIGTLVLVFAGINWLAYQHAYTFTHLAPGTSTHPKTYSTWKEKTDIMLKGIPFYRSPTPPITSEMVTTDTIEGQFPLEIWRMDMTPNEKGVVALFHGHGGNKSSLLSAGIQFYRMGYNVVMVDFRASGNSGGEVCTVGYKEAEDVMLVREWIDIEFPNSRRIALYGTSMGAAAILRAVDELNVEADALILEAPFESLYSAISHRFSAINLPSFPAAACLTYWGGVHNDFNAFSFSPAANAKQITTPTLIFYGKIDPYVSSNEIQSIYKGLQGEKELVVFPLAGHENLVEHDREKWYTHTYWFMHEQLEGWDRNKPPYVGTLIPVSDLEVPADIRNR